MLVDPCNTRPSVLDHRPTGSPPQLLLLDEVEGDLIQMAKDGAFDLIAHGCNCFQTMNAGVALQLATQFPEIRSSDRRTIYGDRAKLGTYSSTQVYANNSARLLTILNCYTQFRYGRPNNGQTNCDYTAIKAVMTRINTEFEGRHLGIPKIGAGLAGGKWSLIRQIIFSNTPNIRVTIVHYLQ